MVRIRLKKFGRKHKPFYRVAAMDSRKPRDASVLEELGWYDPANKDENKQFSLNTDRVKYWIGVGAQPSDTVRYLIRRAEAAAPVGAL